MTHTDREPIDVPFPVEKFRTLELEYLNADIAFWAAKEATLKAQYEERTKELMRAQCSSELQIAAIDFLTPNGRYNRKRAAQLATEFEALGLIGFGPFQKWRFQAGAAHEGGQRRDCPQQSPHRLSRPRRRPRQTGR
ncbi:hypothetical protein OIU35_18130 [Boseaceae bacterium BT-24-1]|nr:hypothetical protein [Boseaceae bacterium BT-24-1]